MSLEKYNSISHRFPGSYLVGGTVRNHVLGITESKSDIDILVPDSAVNTEEYQNYYNSDAVLLKQVGTTGRYRLNSGEVIDLTVTTEKLWNNLFARDFTINALAVNTEGVLIDCSNFLADIKDKTIRTPSFALDTLLADPCRIIRAIRFKVKLSELTDTKWNYSESLYSCMCFKVNTLCEALTLNCNQSRLRNEVTKLFKAAPADVMFNELSRGVPTQLTRCILNAAGGQLCLVG